LIIFLVVNGSRAYLYDGCIQLSNLLVIVLLLLLLLARLILPYSPVYIPIFVLLVLGPELQEIFSWHCVDNLVVYRAGNL